MAKEQRTMDGYVQVYTGNGKGKTTAAIGLALRAAGAGLKVFIAQFVKSEEYSEISALKRFSDLVMCRQYGSGCWIYKEPSSDDVRCAQTGLEDVRHIITGGQYDVVILDEANIASHYGLVSADDLVQLVDMKPANLELVFTGRYAHPRLIERADLCTEMQEVKHYYQKGIFARKGIEN
jgi:cob(I)alamin adenosyltransferase